MLTDRIKEQLKVEPGIKSFAYPHISSWYKLDTNTINFSKKGILYVHIPFCLSKCKYCDYATNYGKENRHDQYKPYVNAVEKEIELLKNFNIKFNSVYFGGGTPTILCEKGLERIINLTHNFQISESAEVSIEVYPSKRMLRNKLELLKENGINRVSIGVQDFNNKVIEFTGRNYTEKEATQIVKESIELFNTNIDLILGLPKQNWKRTLNKALELRPHQITIQPFSNRHSGIIFHHSKYRNLLPNLDQMIEMYDLSCDRLKKEGYTQTSRHQFIREGEHKYEDSITESKTRIGIGAHSISLLPGLTYKNFTSLKEYKEAVERGELPIEKGFILKDDEKIKSYLYYSLSADCGRLSLDENDFLNKFGCRIQDKFPEQVRALEENDLIKVSEEKIDLTRKGIYFTSLLQRTFCNL